MKNLLHKKLAALFVITSILFACNKDDNTTENTEDNSNLIPVASFYLKDDVIDSSECASFFDNSTNSPTSWLWDFGDGDTSTQQNPYHCYYTPGTYSISLTVSNSYGSNTKTKTDFLTVLESPEYSYYTDPRDGTVYKTIEVGGKTWFAENLKYTGDNGFQENITENWGNNDSCNAWCYYDNDSIIGQKYGVLYQWEAAKQACPPGWHLSTSQEWAELISLNAFTVEPSECQEAGHNNTSGFSAMMGGNCEKYNDEYVFKHIHWGAYFWAVPEQNDSLVYCHSIYTSDACFDNYSNADKLSCMSVRCVKDY